MRAASGALRQPLPLLLLVLLLLLLLLPGDLRVVLGAGGRRVRRSQTRWAELGLPIGLDVPVQLLQAQQAQQG